jgi:4-carboxymuconolactone decarboxylase
MKTEDPAFQRGKQVREEMFGAEGIIGLDDADDFMAPLQDYVTRYCFGENWGSDILPRKIRSMITVAILAGQSRPMQLRRHVRGAINNGCTKEEIREVLRHAMVYIGIAHGTDSWAHAATELKEMGAY